MSNKFGFAENLHDKGGGSLIANECEIYGMTWGCDPDCPVLLRGECKTLIEGEESQLENISIGIERGLLDYEEMVELYPILKVRL